MCYVPRTRNCVTIGSFFFMFRPHIHPFSLVTSDVITAPQRDAKLLQRYIATITSFFGRVDLDVVWGI